MAIHTRYHRTNMSQFRSKMTLKEHFGGTGLYDNRFTEPNGLATDIYNNIIVADSNSNYIKVFESNGTFRFKFGIEKLLFPNKVKFTLLLY